jgi:hypothetical protein
MQDFSVPGLSAKLPHPALDSKTKVSMFEPHSRQVLPGQPGRHSSLDRSAAASPIHFYRVPARNVLAEDHNQFLSAALAKAVPQTLMGVLAGTPVFAQISTFGAVRTKSLGSALL